jgi:putative oxidoreductase
MLPDSFYPSSPWLVVAGQLLIAFLFVFRGLDALRKLGFYGRQIGARGVPMPRLVAAGGIAAMLAGGAMVGADWHAAEGAAALIVFTLLANHWFHHFWLMQGMERMTHFYFFCNNIAVIGGLVLVIAINWPA